MATQVNIDTSEFRRFFEKLENAANGDFRKELENYLEAIGFEFLRIVQDEIKRRKVLDTRQLLASFEKGSIDNIWNMTERDLTLEVGTSVNYASYVEDGHWTCKNGEDKRFVPGFWEGDRFVYDPSAKTGMVLKQQWVEGAHYFESALRILDTMFPALLDAKMAEWIEKYFE